MFRRIIYTGAFITLTVMTQAADPRSGVQRAAGQPISHPAHVQRVAAPAGNSQKSSGGLLGGLRSMFGGGGGGGGGDESEVGNGAMPDAPMSQNGGPIQDWSNLSHAPTRSSSNSNSGNKAATTAALPKNLPKPPTSSTGSTNPMCRNRRPPAPWVRHKRKPQNLRPMPRRSHRVRN